jgi:sugar phosphate isomerase/epimerase
VRHIVTVVWGGQFIRSVHFWAAQALYVLLCRRRALLSWLGAQLVVAAGFLPWLYLHYRLLAGQTVDRTENLSLGTLGYILKTAALGLNYMSLSGSVNLDGTTMVSTIRLSDKDAEAIRKAVAAKGIKLVNIGVVKLPPNEAESRKVFEFAKKMGIDTLVAEPETAALDTVEKLCKEYNIKVAIHNHPKPSRYWSPDTVLEAVKGRTPLMGACADTGHWIRSGLDPVECLKKLEGHIICLHFKDLNEKASSDPKAKTKPHDVPWGTGIADVKTMLTELKRQNFRGAFCIEYEHNWGKSMPEIAQSIEYFDLAATALDDADYKPLFQPDLANAVLQPGGWKFESSILASCGKGDIWTRAAYGDFVLDLEFKTEKESNSRPAACVSSSTISWARSTVTSAWPTVAW